MKRLLLAGLAALALACSAPRARADMRFSCCMTRNMCFECTCKQRWFCYGSCVNPLSCAGGYGAPGLWGALHAYGYPPYGVPATAAATTSGSSQPAFTAPQPTPAPKASVSPTSLLQAGYAYYPQTSGYGYGNSYGYGYGAAFGNGAGIYQAPSYWYGD